jgi:hypothetical protein
MGAGHSIAIQNFNENLSILVMLGAYAVMLRADLTINAVIVLFGLLVAGTMYVIYLKHRKDRVV